MIRAKQDSMANQVLDERDELAEHLDAINILTANGSQYRGDAWRLQGRSKKRRARGLTGADL
jgi:hypothetical protein